MSLSKSDTAEGSLPVYHRQIIEMDLDTFGHVNHANYLAIFEEARWEIVTNNGYGLAEVQKYKKGPVILEADLKYLRELKLRENITITTRVDLTESKAGTIYHEMIRADGKVACEAKIVFGFFDLEKRKLIAPTPEWRRALGVAE